MTAQRLLATLGLAALLALSGTVSPSVHAADASDWIYFDLGEVIVTGNPTAGYTYVPGALDFLNDMRIKGYRLALVSNIPESWGAACGEKYVKLQQFLGTRLHETVPLDWTLFDKVVLPPFDRYRKPHPYMFIRALEIACPGRALYVGENAAEISTAAGLGFASFHSNAHTTPGENAVGGPLPAEADVPGLLADGFTFLPPSNCDFGSLVHDVLTPQDQAIGVEGCAIDPAAP